MGALMAWRRGQKLVCIESGPWEDHEGRNADGPEKGDIVTFECWDEPFADGERGLNCFEWPEDTFGADNFRPIVKTDISIFTAMLAPSPKQRVGADA